MPKKDMKWLVVSLVIGLMIFALAGCGGNKAQDAGANTPPADQGAQSGSADNSPLNVTIAAGKNPSGVWYAFAEGIAETVRREYKGSLSAAEPGSITGNPGMVSEGRVPYAMAYSMSAFAALKGQEPYDKAYPNVTAVGVVIPTNAFQFVVSKESGLTSIEDIKSKKFPLKISVDEKGSVADIVTRAVLEAYGMSYQDLESFGGTIFNLSGSKTFDMMSDGRMDAMPDALPIPSGDILEASATLKLNMLPLNDDAIQKVGEKLGMNKTIVKSGSYNFLNSDVPTLNTGVLLLTSKDRPADEVYKMAKAIYNNFDYLHSVHEGFKDLNKDTILETAGVPLHPGAEKFYREIGILK